MCKIIVCITGSARQPRMSARQADEITTTLPRLAITPWIMCVCDGGESGGALEPAAEALGSARQESLNDATSCGWMPLMLMQGPRLISSNVIIYSQFEYEHVIVFGIENNRN